MTTIKFRLSTTALSMECLRYLNKVLRVEVPGKAKVALMSASMLYFSLIISLGPCYL